MIEDNPSREFIPQRPTFFEVAHTELSVLSPFETKIVLIRPDAEFDAIRPHEEYDEENLQVVKESLHTFRWKGKPIAAFGMNQDLYYALPRGVSFLPELPENKLVVADGTDRLEAIRRLNKWALREQIPFKLFPFIPVQVFPNFSKCIRIESWISRNTHTIQEIIDRVKRGELLPPNETRFMIGFNHTSQISRNNFIDDDRDIDSKVLNSDSLLRVRTLQPDCYISEKQMIDLSRLYKLLTVLGQLNNEPFSIVDIPMPGLSL